MMFLYADDSKAPWIIAGDQSQRERAVGES